MALGFSVLSVAVTEGGSTTAGEQLTLTCTVSVLEGYSGTPQVELKDPSGTPLTNTYVCVCVCVKKDPCMKMLRKPLYYSLIATLLKQS